jgi:hypothetical protein
MFNVLLQEKVASDMLVFKYLPHGLLNFDMPNGLPQAKFFVLKTIRYLEVLFEREDNKIKKANAEIKNLRFANYKKIFNE